LTEPPAAGTLSSLDGFQLASVPRLVGYMFEGFGVVNAVLRSSPSDALKRAALEHGRTLKGRQPESAGLIMSVEAILAKLGVAAPARPTSPDQFREWARAVEGASPPAGDPVVSLGKVVAGAVLAASLGYLLQSLLAAAPGDPFLGDQLASVAETQRRTRIELDALGASSALAEPVLSAIPRIEAELDRAPSIETATTSELQTLITNLNHLRVELEKALATGPAART